MHLMLDRREYQTTYTRSAGGHVEELLAGHYVQLLCSELAIQQKSLWNHSLLSMYEPFETTTRDYI